MKRQLLLLVLVLWTSAACTSALQTSVGTRAPDGSAGTPTGALTEQAPPPKIVLPTPTPLPAADSNSVAGGEAQPTAAPPPAVVDVAGIDLNLQPVIAGLDTPVFVTHAGDGSGRLFIVEKTGAIRIFQDGQLLATPFLDVSELVSLANEQGLLGLAFAPDYGASGHFYINYTDRAGDTVVARYGIAADDPNRADPASATPLLNIDQPAPNHNGGMLAFGPDGYLYIGMGDGGAANDRFGNGQNPAALLGKMLRIDVANPSASAPYDIPTDNPWVTAPWNGQEMRAEVWALGLRNPWRFSFDRATGDLWIGDVGQNQYEEVNFVAQGRSGLNFGWPIVEANHCFTATNCDQTGLELPVAEYSHAGHCSVTGGYVYRGAAIPAWDGVYFYGDYCSGDIWALGAGADGTWQNSEVATGVGNISSFGEDEEGEVYLTTLDGTVYRLAADQ